MELKLKQALHNWTMLNDSLPDLSEQEVKQMLDFEMQYENRKTFLERLHARYNTLRVMRERSEMLAKGK
jgi:hypothetical protein